jgi:hypothetical protein
MRSSPIDRPGRPVAARQRRRSPEFENDLGCRHAGVRAGRSSAGRHRTRPSATRAWNCPCVRHAGHRRPVPVDHPRSVAAARSWPHTQGRCGNRSVRSSGSSVHARWNPGAPECLPGLRFGSTQSGLPDQISSESSLRPLMASLASEWPLRQTHRAWRAGSHRYNLDCGVGRHSRILGVGVLCDLLLE